MMGIYWWEMWPGLNRAAEALVSLWIPVWITIVGVFLGIKELNK